MIRAVFFDAGGTLLRTAEPVGFTYAKLAQSYGWKPDAEKMEAGFRAAWKKRTREGAGAAKILEESGWREILRFSAEFAGLPMDFPFEDYFQEVHAVFAQPAMWCDFPEIGQALDRCTAKGVRVGVLSNWDFRLRTVLAGFSWSTRFDPVLISAEVGAEKPDPAIFRYAENSTGTQAGECALVGDDPLSDLAGAKAAGWHCALVDRPKRGLGEALEHLGL